MRRAEPRRALALIMASRGLSEAVAFATVAAIVHSITAGRDPIALWPTALELFGVTLILVAVLRERGTLRQSAVLAAAVIVGAAAWSLTFATRSPDALAVLSRVVSFGIAGEVYLWRTLSMARGLQRWHEVRDAALFALVGVILAALLPGPIDRDALPAIALAVAVSGAVALSVARSTEELALSSAQVRGRPAGSAATGSAFVLGLFAIAVALVLPAAQEVLASLVARVGPILAEALFWLLLPLGYVAQYVVYFVFWLRQLLGLPEGQIAPPRPPAVPDDAARLREIAAVRPYVYGAVEVLVALVALLFAVALVVRLAQERRALLPAGAVLERAPVEGIGLGATLRSLFPRRRVRPPAPRDDGTPGAALRRIYWHLLEVAERHGPGWREPAETPAEHEDRLGRVAPRWRAAAPIVRAFEALRYGEREPDAPTLAAARAALREIEASS